MTGIVDFLGLARCKKEGQELQKTLASLRILKSYLVVMNARPPANPFYRDALIELKLLQLRLRSSAQDSKKEIPSRPARALLFESIEPAMSGLDELIKLLTWFAAQRDEELSDTSASSPQLTG